MKWSQQRLAYELLDELNENATEPEVVSFYESLKKALNRASTEPDLLRRYLDIISLHQDFEKANIIAPKYISTNQLSNDMESGMSQISKKIAKMII